MVDNASPSTESLVSGLAQTNLDEKDEELPEYVSSGDVSPVGSSVSQSNKQTMEIDASMIANAVNMITKLQDEVLFHYQVSLVLN